MLSRVSQFRIARGDSGATRMICDTFQKVKKRRLFFLTASYRLFSVDVDYLLKLQVSLVTRNAFD